MLGGNIMKVDIAASAASARQTQGSSCRNWRARRAAMTVTATRKTAMYDSPRLKMTYWGRLLWVKRKLFSGAHSERTASSMLTHLRSHAAGKRKKAMLPKADKMASAPNQRGWRERYAMASNTSNAAKA